MNHTVVKLITSPMNLIHLDSEPYASAKVLLGQAFAKNGQIPCRYAVTIKYPPLPPPPLPSSAQVPGIWPTPGAPELRGEGRRARDDGVGSGSG